MASYYSKILGLTFKKPSRVSYLFSRAFRLDSWAYLSTNSYLSIIKERNLRITNTDDQYVYAKDSKNTYVGPLLNSEATLDLSPVAAARLKRVFEKLNLLNMHKLEYVALINNIILRSYKEFMPSKSIAMRTCDLSERSVFIDIGCFRGYLSLKAARLVGNSGKVISIDANNTSIEIVKKHIELNNLKNCDAIHAAFVTSNFNKEYIAFQDAGDASTDNSVISKYIPEQSNKIKVKAINIKDIINMIPTNLVNSNLVFSITTNGTEIEILDDILSNVSGKITCIIPSLHIFDEMLPGLENIKSKFPNVIMHHEFPWVLVRRFN